MGIEYSIDDYLASHRSGLTRTLADKHLRMIQAEKVFERWAAKHLKPGTRLLVWRAMGGGKYQTVRATFARLGAPFFAGEVNVVPHPDDAHMLPECLRCRGSISNEFMVSLSTISFDESPANH